MTLLFAFLVALSLTRAFVPLLIRVGPRVGLVDVPGPRKIHTAPVPLCGGLAIAGAAVLPVLMWGEVDRGFALGLAAAALIVAVGALDDARPLPPVWRLGAQAVAVAMVLFAGIRFASLPLLGLDPAAAWLAIPATAFVILANTNAVNLADGLDGLAGGLVVPTFLAIGLLAHAGDGGTTLLVCAALIGALLGFLRFNTYPASVFLGDAGSTFLGFAAAVLAVQLVQRCNPALNPAIVPLLLGVPLLDTGYTVLRRAVGGQPLFRADRRHLHHQLLDLGLSQTAAVAALYVLQALMVGTAVLLRYESDAEVIGAYALIALTVLVPLVTAFAAEKPVVLKSATGAPPANGRDLEIWRRRPTERRNLWLRRRAWLPATALTTVKLGVAGLVVLGSFMPTAVPRDFAVAAVCTAALCLVMLTVVPLRSMTARRLLIYLAAGFATYLLVSATATAMAAADQPWPGWVLAAYLVLLASALVIAIRVTRRDQFRVTPQDLLVLFLAFAAPNFTGEALAQYHLREVVAVLIVLFYAAEFVLAKERDSWPGLDVAALVALAVISIRGVLQIF